MAVVVIVHMTVEPGNVEKLWARLVLIGSVAARCGG
jgi:hypothetical protein